MNLRLRIGSAVCLFVLLLGFTASSQASPELGVKFPAFKLQALDSQFYGTEDTEGKISILYFLGYNCAPCVAAGPYLERDLYQQVLTKPNVQMLGLDVWNGTIVQLSQYKSITGITFPLLRQAGLNRNYAGAGLSDMVIVDQEGYVRLVVNGENTDAYPVVMNMIESLQNKTPIVTMVTKSLYFGRTMNVGQTKSQDVTVSNVGAGTLEIKGIKTSVPDVTMDPPAFTLQAYESKTVTVTFSPTQTGTFSGDVFLEHNNSGVQTLQVPIIEVAVEGQVFPSISLAQNSLDFGQVDLDKAIEKVITITNNGPGVLTVSDVVSDIDGLVVSDRQFSLLANASKDLTITFQPKTQGAFSGVIQVMSDDPAQGMIAVSLSGTAIFIPADPRADFDGSGKVDFPDFVAFVQHFGATDATFDLNGSGQVDFPDFLMFVQSFGKLVTN